MKSETRALHGHVRVRTGCMKSETRIGVFPNIAWACQGQDSLHGIVRRRTCRMKCKTRFDILALIVSPPFRANSAQPCNHLSLSHLPLLPPWQHPQQQQRSLPVLPPLQRSLQSQQHLHLMLPSALPVRSGALPPAPALPPAAARLLRLRAPPRTPHRRGVALRLLRLHRLHFDFACSWGLQLQEHREG